MYINKVVINNIKSVQDFEMTFMPGKQAGWHVLIGNNGSGKTTILRAIALLLIGREGMAGLRQNWYNWLNTNADTGNIQLIIEPKNREYEMYEQHSGLPLELKISNGPNKLTELDFKDHDFRSEKIHRSNINYAKWFSAGFGAFRRFSGGSGEWDSIYKNLQLAELASHLSLFGESVSFVEISNWIKDLKIDENDKKNDNLSSLIKFINSPGFLPEGVSFDDVTSDGILFKDSYGTEVEINQLSEGYRSILSLTFELIRLLNTTYRKNNFFKETNGYIYIDYPGVVLIDEADAHLHPTWQTKLGQWFTKYFPNIQFIVTTHSPLICQGCIKEDGTINGSTWLMTRPGYDEKSRKLDNDEMNKLVFGNISDAYATGVFGDVQRTETSVNMLKELAKLNKLKLFGQISDTNEIRRLVLEKIFTTDVTNDFE